MFTNIMRRPFKFSTNKTDNSTATDQPNPVQENDAIAAAQAEDLTLHYEPISFEESKQHLKQGVVQSLKENYIYWFNECLQTLYAKQGAICPKLAQKQILKTINHDIEQVIGSISDQPLNGAVGSSSTLHTTPLATDAANEQLVRTISEINIDLFSALLHFNIRLCKLFELNEIDLNDSPLNPKLCTQLFQKALHATMIPAQSQATLIIEFSTIISQQYTQLMSESNKMILNAIQQQKALESSDADTDAGKHQDGKSTCPSRCPSQKLRQGFEDKAVEGNRSADEALSVSHDAVINILGASPTPTTIHPLIKEWEKYLFKLFFKKGTSSQEWSHALRTMVSIRHFVEEDANIQSKQTYLDGLNDTIDECRQGLAYNLLSHEKIEALVKPLDEIAIAAIYHAELDLEYGVYG